MESDTNQFANAFWPEIVERTQNYVRRKLESDSSGHDWWHVYRVWRTAIQIGKEENVDMFVVELAALLHDIADWKFHDGDQDEGPRQAGKWLRQCGVDDGVIAHVCEIIATMSFKGAGVETPMRTREGMVVQDADRLDAIGAVGIGRTFAFGGHKGRPMHDPNVQPENHETFEQYKLSNGPTISHFYEKLLLIRDLLNTKTARELALGRHEFMEHFLERFFEEWEGKA